MSEYMFGTGRGRLTASVVKRANAIAAKHGAGFTYIAPSRTWTASNWWFTGPNYGAPFDKALSDAVTADLRAAGLADALRIAL